MKPIPLLKMGKMVFQQIKRGGWGALHILKDLNQKHLENLMKVEPKNAN
jgi:hypothetical protein